MTTTITKTKLDKATVNAVAHNLILDQVLQSAWDFVCDLAPTNTFEYAFVNSASEDYCDTIWHTTQNVKLSESIDLIDARDMYNTALDNYSCLIDTHITNIRVSEVNANLDELYGDTAISGNNYSLLPCTLATFVKH